MSILEKKRRIEELMGLNESAVKSNERYDVEISKLGADNKVYAIIREQQKHYIKIAANKEGLVVEDFGYIGGLANKHVEAYPTYERALSKLQLKLGSLNESYGKMGAKVNCFASDCLIKEEVDRLNNQKSKINSFDEFKGMFNSMKVKFGEDGVSRLNEDTNLGYVDYQAIKDVPEAPDTIKLADVETPYTEEDGYLNNLGTNTKKVGETEGGDGTKIDNVADDVEAEETTVDDKGVADVDVDDDDFEVAGGEGVEAEESEEVDIDIEVEDDDSEETVKESKEINEISTGLAQRAGVEAYGKYLDSDGEGDNINAKIKKSQGDKFTNYVNPEIVSFARANGFDVLGVKDGVSIGSSAGDGSHFTIIVSPGGKYRFARGTINDVPSEKLKALSNLVKKIGSDLGPQNIGESKVSKTELMEILKKKI